MTKILVIDDLRVFTFDAVYARTVDDAYFQITDHGPWDEVWLDHDMGLFGAAHGGDVSNLTDFLEREAIEGHMYDVKAFIIHSANPSGKMRMFHALIKYYDVLIHPNPWPLVAKEDYRDDKRTLR